MDDAASQAALAHPVHLRMAGRDRPEHGAGLVRPERVDGASRGLVDRQPAFALCEHRERPSREESRIGGIGQGPLVAGRLKRTHLEAAAAGQ